MGSQTNSVVAPALRQPYPWLWQPTTTSNATEVLLYLAETSNDLSKINITFRARLWLAVTCRVKPFGLIARAAQGK